MDWNWFGFGIVVLVVVNNMWDDYLKRNYPRSDD